MLAHEDTGAELTFAQYRDACLRAAAGLHADHGVGPGTGVSWELPTWNESLVLVGALARLGARQNPLIPIYRGREVGFITEQSDARLLVVPTVYRGFDFEAMAGEIAAGRTGLSVLVVDRDLPDGDPAGLPEVEPPPATAAEAPVRWLFYTSGTTADPKGAPHTDLTVMASALAMAECLDIRPDDVSALIFPFTHIGGHRLADGGPVHRVPPPHHRGLRPGHHPGVPGRQRGDPGRLGHPVPHGLPGRPAGQGRATASSRTSVPIPEGAHPSRPSSTTT